VAPPASALASPEAAPAPVSLTIPIIGVQTRLITLGLASDGAMQVPTDYSVAGWFTGSPRPGALGSSIIVGHIDNTHGPAVFYRLRELAKGNKIYVKRADGSLAEFSVTSIQSYDKDHFPTQDVYGAVPDAELRLITCSGAFDDQTRHYVQNLVVYATEVT
jgi:LPXTG-site transpeptidase (sortase) family protein